jgi:hypothetical protein
MTLTPILIEERRFTSDTSCDLLEVCDSVIAVLTPAQLAEWIIDFGAAWPEDIINTDEATLDGSILQVFDIAGVLFVTNGRAPPLKNSAKIVTSPVKEL